MFSEELTSRFLYFARVKLASSCLHWEDRVYCFFVVYVFQGLLVEEYSRCARWYLVLFGNSVCIVVVVKIGVFRERQLVSNAHCTGATPKPLIFWRWVAPFVVRVVDVLYPSGSIPAALGDLMALQELRLFENQLSGEPSKLWLASVKCLLSSIRSFQLWLQCTAGIQNGCVSSVLRLFPRKKC